MGFLWILGAADRWPQPVFLLALSHLGSLRPPAEGPGAGTEPANSLGIHVSK